MRVFSGENLNLSLVVFLLKLIFIDLYRLTFIKTIALLVADNYG